MTRTALLPRAAMISDPEPGPAAARNGHTMGKIVTKAAPPKTARTRKPAAAAAAVRSERPLESNLSYRLSFISFMIGRVTGPVLAAHGLTNQQWKVLSVIAQVAPATAQEVTRWVTLDKSAVSRTVRSLLELNLIGRKLQVEDARNVHLFLTPKGNTLQQRIAQQMGAVQADLLRDVSSAAAASMFETLRRVEDRIAARIAVDGASQPGEDDA